MCGNSINKNILQSLHGFFRRLPESRYRERPNNEKKKPRNPWQSKQSSTSFTNTHFVTLSLSPSLSPFLRILLLLLCTFFSGVPVIPAAWTSVHSSLEEHYKGEWIGNTQPYRKEHLPAQTVCVCESGVRERERDSTITMYLSLTSKGAPNGFSTSKHKLTPKDRQKR